MPLYYRKQSEDGCDIHKGMNSITVQGKVKELASNKWKIEFLIKRSNEQKKKGGGGGDDVVTQIFAMQVVGKSTKRRVESCWMV